MSRPASELRKNNVPNRIRLNNCQRYSTDGLFTDVVNSFVKRVIYYTNDLFEQTITNLFTRDLQTYLFAEANQYN